MNYDFICPADHGALRQHESGFCCPVCSKTYPVLQGVICTLDAPDQFYEGAYKNHTSYTPRRDNFLFSWPLWVINSGWLWNIRKYIPKGSLLLELGCAGGVNFLGSHYKTIGCDLSFSSLATIECYSFKVQMDASKCINLATNSVDAIVSSYFWEHISPSIKPAILSECYRVLKPGGKLVFLYDVETKNPLINWYRKLNYPMYQKQFIDGDGHAGYESIESNIDRYKRCGFSVLKSQGLEKTPIQSPSIYVKLKEFCSSSRGFFSVLAKLGSSPYFYPFSLLLRVVDTLIGPLLPNGWARIHLVILRK